VPSTPPPPPIRPDPLPASLTPEAALSRLPSELPLAICWSGTNNHPESRWVILAPIESTICDDLHPIVRDQAPIAPLSATSIPAADHPPFLGGHIGFISFDAAGIFEPALKLSAAANPPWPSMVFHHTPGALVFDRLRQRWLSVGTRTPSLRELESHLANHAKAPPPTESFRVSLPADHHRALELARTHYTAAVRSALELIARGDIYQVNLAHALRFDFTGSARALFSELMRSANPWMGSFIPVSPLPPFPLGRSIACASPELFFRLEPDQTNPALLRITTRPMKGTRTANHPSTDAARDLLGSAKDHAELTMIIDLMRNDLGRVCLPGSVRVTAPRSLEHHAVGEASILQTTGTVTGLLDPQRTTLDILRALFPGGSITGAPKISAVKAIRSLENFARGPYCGCLGFLSTSGHACFNITIRTALIDQTTLTWPVGAGIVADSDPDKEWQETLDKARALTQMLDENRSHHGVTERA
jgi:para-aminobenzoate synthetase component 1